MFNPLAGLGHRPSWTLWWQSWTPSACQRVSTTEPPSGLAGPSVGSEVFTVVTVSTGEFPNYPQTSADGSLVFVVNSGSNTVTVAHAQAPFTVVATLTVGSHPFNLALTPDGRTMVVANAGDDTTSLIDIPTLGVSAPISIHRANAPKPVPKNQKLNVRISNDGRYAWIGDRWGRRSV